MDAYYFDKLRVTPKKERQFDAKILEMGILKSQPGIRDSAEYIAAKDAFMDMTMSCNAEEVIQWMNHWMGKAVEFGIQYNDLDWMIFFLAAYDIFNEVLTAKLQLPK